MTTRDGDRRANPRGSATTHGIVSARVRPGHHADVIDLSTSGVLIDVSIRLLPGAPVELQFEAAHRRTTISGRIVRCCVIRLASSSVSYRAGIAFDSASPWFVDDLASGYALPIGESDSERAGG